MSIYSPQINMHNMTIALILIPQAKLFPLDYAVPESMSIQKGQLVIVPFRNKKMLGIVLETNIISEAKKLKEIEEVFSLSSSSPLPSSLDARGPSSLLLNTGSRVVAQDDDSIKIKITISPSTIEFITIFKTINYVIFN